MTDRLTPPQLPAWALRDLAEQIWNASDAEVMNSLRRTLEVEAARREAEAKPDTRVYGGAITGSGPAVHILDLTKPDNKLGRAAEPAASKPTGEREGPDSAAAPKRIVPNHDGKGCVRGQSFDLPPEDKPAPAADDPKERVFTYDTGGGYMRSMTAPHVEAEFARLQARVRELEEESRINGECCDRAQDMSAKWRKDLNAEKARADRLAAVLSSISFSCDDASFYKDCALTFHAPHAMTLRLRNDSSKSFIIEDFEQRRRAALASEGGDRG